MARGATRTLNFKSPSSYPSFTLVISRSLHVGPPQQIPYAYGQIQRQRMYRQIASHSDSASARNQRDWSMVRRFFLPRLSKLTRIPPDR